MTLSIIIPAYNEAATINKLLTYLLQNKNEKLSEVIVSDGGSEDDTIAIARKAGAAAVLSPTKGRAAQMNYGASIAKGDVLYFVHADCFPPVSFINDIQKAIGEGYSVGRYRTRFDSPKAILKINAWFTRFDFFICMGGDQTLFITQTLFAACTGFKPEMKIMEEYEFCERARRQGRYKIIQDDVLVSARKYDTNSWLTVQLANSKIVRMYKRGASQQAMIETYKQMLSYRKNAF